MSKEDSLRKKVFVVWPLTLLVYGIMLFMLAFVLGLFWIIGSKIIGCYGYFRYSLVCNLCYGTNFILISECFC